MSQPVWKLVANLGDVNPLDYGGYFVYVDETGVYQPEAELLREYDESYTVHRFRLEQCTLTDGILSDNSFHPSHPAWFADSLVSIKVYGGTEDLIPLLCSADPIQRAIAYQAIGDYHGFENLDSYTITLTRKEVKKRYKL